MSVYNNDQLIAALQVSAQGSPELLFMVAAAKSLPVGEYLIIDPEAGDQVPAGLYGLPTQRIVDWEGTELPDMAGYGWICQMENRAGMGLEITLGGSPLSSAMSFWIIPAGLLGWLDQD